MDIPTPDPITGGWLTERLREAGFPGVEMRGFEATRIGTGQPGQCGVYDPIDSFPETGLAVLRDLLPGEPARPSRVPPHGPGR